MFHVIQKLRAFLDKKPRIRFLPLFVPMLASTILEMAASL